MHEIILTDGEFKSLKRLEALLNNPELGRWYHNQFIGLGLLPIPYELPKDIKNWRKIFKDNL